MLCWEWRSRDRLEPALRADLVAGDSVLGACGYRAPHDAIACDRPVASRSVSLVPTVVPTGPFTIQSPPRLRRPSAKSGPAIFSTQESTNAELRPPTPSPVTGDSTSPSAITHTRRSGCCAWSRWAWPGSDRIEARVFDRSRYFGVYQYLKQNVLFATGPDTNLCQPVRCCR